MTDSDMTGVYNDRQWYDRCLQWQTVIWRMFTMADSDMTDVDNDRQWYDGCLQWQTVIWQTFTMTDSDMTDVYNDRQWYGKVRLSPEKCFQKWSYGFLLTTWL